MLLKVLLGEENLKPQENFYRVWRCKFGAIGILWSMLTQIDSELSDSHQRDSSLSTSVWVTIMIHDIILNMFFNNIYIYYINIYMCVCIIEFTCFICSMVKNEIVRPHWGLVIILLEDSHCGMTIYHVT